MNLFGLGMDSKIEDVLHEVGCNTRLYNILMYNINFAKVHNRLQPKASHGYVSGKDEVITMRDLVNMSREKILNVKNLGNKSVDQIKSIFKYCGINDIKGWKNLDVTKRYYDSEKNRYLEKSA